MWKASFLFRFSWTFVQQKQLVVLGSSTLLLDTGLLTRKSAEVVQLGTTHLTNLVDFDAFDVRRLDGEDTLYTNGARHLAYGETLLVLMTGNLDNNAAIQLDTLLVTFDDFVCYSDGVTSLELGELLASSKSFFSNLN